MYWCHGRLSCFWNVGGDEFLGDTVGGDEFLGDAVGLMLCFVFMLLRRFVTWPCKNLWASLVIWGAVLLPLFQVNYNNFRNCTCWENNVLCLAFVMYEIVFSSLSRYPFGNEIRLDLNCMVAWALAWVFSGLPWSYNSTNSSIHRIFINPYFRLLLWP
jgi:hypothetical protein